jgi:hypothetical protein
VQRKKRERERERERRDEKTEADEYTHGEREIWKDIQCKRMTQHIKEIGYKKKKNAL